MVDFIYKKSFLKIREMAFVSINDISIDNSDVIYLHSNDENNMLCKGAYNGIAQKQWTLVNGLDETEEDLLKRVKKNCKYEIRRATKEETEFKVYGENGLAFNEDLLNDFESTYNKLFVEKGLSNRFNRNLVEEGINNKQIIITTSSSKMYDATVYHAYLVDGTRAVLMYSASAIWGEEDKEKINAIGRMNKYLHWKDMLWFKANNYSIYEWGGISSPEQPNGIDRFKMEFGGEIVFFYNYIIGNNFWGRLYCLLAKKKYALTDD